MDHSTFEPRSTTGNRHGQGIGRRIGLAICLSLPFWLGLGLIMSLIRS